MLTMWTGLQISDAVALKKRAQSKMVSCVRTKNPKHQFSFVADEFIAYLGKADALREWLLLLGREL